MKITIKEKLNLDLYGVAGVAANQDWPGTGSELMKVLWQEIKTHQLPHKGINVWLYEAGAQMFVGVELSAPLPQGTRLERRHVQLAHYVSYCHVGPYHQIATAFPALQATMTQQGISVELPYLEIYGHWTPDESKLETEMIWNCVTPIA